MEKKHKPSPSQGCGSRGGCGEERGVKVGGRYFSASDAAKNFGALLDAAEDDPAIIHRHGRPRAAVLSWRLFEMYKKAYDAAFEEREIRLLELRLKAALAGRLGNCDRLRAFSRRLLAGEARLDEKSRAEQSVAKLE